jgi:hypothetical protein
MSIVQSLEQTVTQLSPAELREFRNWFAEFDAANWDAQIEADAAAGKFDELANEALAEYQAGKARKL